MVSMLQKKEARLFGRAPVATQNIATITAEADSLLYSWML
jgi:hypothetical protein